MKRFAWISMWFLALPAFAAEVDPARELDKFFENEVRPVLSKRCFECHGEKKQKGGLRVDQIAYLKTGGDTGPALVPGKPEESPLIEAVRYTKPDFQMPPKERLPDAEVAVLEKWVKMGAPWPEHGAKAVSIEGGFTEEQRRFWCFQPLANPVPPDAGASWARNDIDRFVAAKHAELGLRPAPEADRSELVRRLYYDVHGLPPSAAEAAAFVSDKRQDAYERLVDQLLASARYGERWGQHWLDLVRYAESDGYNADEYRPAVWPYRDWVIKSLNEDKPYDRFVREQLAGDEIAPQDPSVLIATTYLRHPVYEWNQRDVRGQWDIILTDMTDTSGELFLGLSFGCARCHNHKFDPILQKDYYRLRAFFAPVHWRDDLKLATPEEKAQYAAKEAAWEAATAGVRAKIDALVKPLIEGRAQKALSMFTDDLQAMVRKSAGERAALERQLAGLCERQMQRERKTFEALKALKSDEAKARYKELQEELKTFDHLKPKPLMDAFVATDTGASPPPTLLKTRKGEQDIAPGFLTMLEPAEPRIEPIGNSTGRRTVLANWITRPDNQLSTRVIVNRVWQYHFGKGIVASSSDFGKLGEKPSHPELLDWLARRFVAGGWSLKKLHRDILLSATYRQTARRQPDADIARIDPANKFLWRFSPRRLDAEQVRDSLLAASGELDLKGGGPAEDGNSFRRSVYTMKKRNNQNELMRSLDAPSGFSSTAERQSTTTPTQALLLLNGEWTLARARKLATRSQSIDELWKTVLGRGPLPKEREAAAAFLRKRGGAGGPSANLAALGADGPSDFREGTPHERLQVQTSEVEGDEFTVEAVVRLDSVDSGTSVRVLASRWTGAKDSIEGFGWSLGVTGEKSRYSPRNLIMQLVGEDENANIAYEVVASELQIELGRRYQVSVAVSCSEHTVKFQLRDLERPGEVTHSAVVPHPVRSKLGGGSAALTLGGLNKRTPHHWQGSIEAFRLARGLEEGFSDVDVERWKPALLTWRASETLPQGFAWSGVDAKSTEIGDGPQRAMNDLAQVLLNANEFFYLH